jgi:hypothetical protein
VLLISGCQDNQLSADGDRNGLFTETLLRVWDGGAFRGDYTQFHRQIADRMPATQTPNLFRAGAPAAAFEAERPFAIGAGGGTAPVPGPAARPAISAPATVSASSSPRFSVHPGDGRAFAVEVATDARCFDPARNPGLQSDDNFFASWRTPPLRSEPAYPAEYVLPQAAWDRLRRASRVYYRVWASDGASAWINPVASTPDSDAQSAPSFSVEKTGGGAVLPLIEGPDAIPNDSTPPRFLLNPGPGRYAAVEVATSPEYFMYARHGAARTDDNFFASWRATPFVGSASYPMSYDMPRAAWDRLRRGAARLYYRVWATDSPNAWVNAVSSTPDADALSARSFALTAPARERGDTMTPSGTQSAPVLAVGDGG